MGIGQASLECFEIILDENLTISKRYRSTYAIEAAQPEVVEPSNNGSALPTDSISVEGVIRSGRIVLFASSKAPIPEDAMRLVLTPVEGQSITLEGATVPQADEGRLALLKIAKSRNNGVFLSFILPQLRLKNCDVTIEGEPDRVISWASPKTSLAVLLPTQVSEFRSGIAFTKTRHLDRETQVQLAANILAQSRWPPQLRSYVISAFIILIYRLVEAADYDRLPFALSDAERIQSMARDLKAGGSVREDAVQMQLSLATALWHLGALLDDETLFDQQLSRLVDLHETGAIRPTYGWNLAATFLLIGVRSLTQRNTDSARRAFATAVDVFYESVSSRCPVVDQFRELAIVHHSAYLAMRCLGQVEDKQQIDERLFAAVIDHCLRVKTDVMRAALRRRLLLDPPDLSDASRVLNSLERHSNKRIR